MILLTASAASDQGKRTYYVRAILPTRKQCEARFASLPHAKDDHVIHLTTSWYGIDRLIKQGNKVLV